MQRFVDIYALFGLLACCASQALLFRSCQINELQLGNCDISWVTQILRLNRQTKDAVGSRTEVVKIVAGEDAVASTVLVKVEHLLRCSRFKNVQVLHHELVFLGPADAEASLPLDRVPTFADTLYDLRIEQVKHFLVIDLQETHEDAVDAIRLESFHFFNSGEELVDAALRDTNVFWVDLVLRESRRVDTTDPHIATLHCVSLARSSLTVGKNRAVIALFTRIMWLRKCSSCCQIISRLCKPCCNG